MINLSKKNNKGFVALFVVIIIGFSLSIYLTISSQSSVLRMQNNRISNSRQLAYYLADSCAEIALQRIRNEDYVGSGTFNASYGSCDYVISNQGGEDRLIQTEANVKDSIQRVEVEIDQISTQINVVSWQHVKN